jgi:hypothetical protein
LGWVLVDDYQDCLRRDLVIGVWTTLSVFRDAGGRFAKRHTEIERRKDHQTQRKKKKRAGEWRRAQDS